MTEVRTWLRANLFRSPVDGVISVAVGSVIFYALYRFLRFVFVTGRWTIVKDNLSLYITGSWPDDELWRLAVVVVGVAFASGLVAGYVVVSRRDKPAEVEPPSGAARVVDLVERLWPTVVAVVLLLALVETPGPWLVAGGALLAGVAGRVAGTRLPPSIGLILTSVLLIFAVAMVWVLASGVGWDNWGGLILNLFLASVSILLCFPLGVLLALGRRSSFPVIRWISTSYIELFRGVPLIALLLMANVALGFFVPQSMAPGKVVRAIVVFILFTAAYVAEIVRGGLQSVPAGQIEAGRALGLSPIAVTTRIVLPQAIRNVIPALVGQFISLFKDTTLAGAAMGLTDLLAGAEASTSQAAFSGQGLIVETLVFVLLVFWAGSYTMSRESQRLETRLGVGER